ncbi:MAG: hypothetical protein H6861_05145 [Rhodospirillales bacterium]|nr:hypothetical protein [Rhodospirillales bacterium]
MSDSNENGDASLTRQFLVQAEAQMASEDSRGLSQALETMKTAQEHFVNALKGSSEKLEDAAFQDRLYSAVAGSTALVSDMLNLLEENGVDVGGMRQSANDLTHWALDKVDDAFDHEEDPQILQGIAGLSQYNTDDGLNGP